MVRPVPVHVEDLCISSPPGPLVAVELTGMKPTYSVGVLPEGYGLCPSCVPSAKSPGVGVA